MAAARRRKDPKPRSTRNRTGDEFEVQNKDPNKVYKWTYKAIVEKGIDYMLGLGYEIERHHPDGVKVLGRHRFKADQEIEVQGYVLMSIAKEEAEDIEQFGPQGNTGQDQADKIEARIITKRGGRDALRGIGLEKRHAHVENEISEPYLDLES